VGFDDIPLVAFFDPPLTTIRVPAFDLGHAAGVALLARLAGSAAPTETLLPTELIVRGTTGPPPSPLPGVGL
jgi:LacI family transcriptional regulator